MIKAKLAIIGSGPAGYTAAIYIARAGYKPILFAGPEPGGQLINTTLVENYPGWPDGIMGPDLMAAMRTQAEKFGTQVVNQTVNRVDLSGPPFGLWSDDQEYRLDGLIIATGAKANWLGLPNEQRLRGHGVSACATCDGFLFKQKRVAVVGGGDTAMEEAGCLSKFAAGVDLLIRNQAPTASRIMFERAKANPKITVHLDTEVVDVIGDNRVEAILVRNGQDKREQKIPVNGLFVAIGHRPNTEIFQGQLPLDDRGYLRTERHVYSKIPGVFIAGDVGDPVYRQAVTAAGFGCMAAIAAEKYFSNAGSQDH